MIGLLNGLCDHLPLLPGACSTVSVSSFPFCSGFVVHRQSTSRFVCCSCGAVEQCGRRGDHPVVTLCLNNLYFHASRFTREAIIGQCNFEVPSPLFSHFTPHFFTRELNVARVPKTWREDVKLALSPSARCDFCWPTRSIFCRMSNKNRIVWTCAKHCWIRS